MTTEIRLESSPAASPLFGRDHELRIVERILAAAAGGVGEAVLLRGDTGTGKSAVLNTARALAAERGFYVCAATGIESETAIPYAGLHQVLKPFLPRIHELMPRQQNALLTAFGLDDGPAPEMLMVGLAALQLISDPADTSPVLVVVDDAQWLDASSVDVLAFVARRINTERIGLVVAVRNGIPARIGDAGLPEHGVAPLDVGAAEALLDVVAPGLPATSRQRVLADSAGNPLALIELSQAIDQHNGTRASSSLHLPISYRLERSFLRQVSQLPTTTAFVLLVAAADDSCDVGEILAAATVALADPASTASLDPAVAVGLVEVLGHELQFRHPLVRSAIYQSAPPSQRAAAHTALAEILQPHKERRAWHRAAACIGQDDDVARDLEAAAGTAFDRGSARTAAVILGRAASLGESGKSRGRLLLRSAEVNIRLGDLEVARQQLADAMREQLTEEEELRALIWSEAINDRKWFSSATIDVFASLAGDLARSSATGKDLALQALFQFVIAAWYEDVAPETRNRMVEMVQQLKRGDDDMEALAIATFADPDRQLGALAERSAHFVPERLSVATQRTIGVTFGGASDYERAWPWLSAAADGYRQEGLLGTLADTLVPLVWAAIPLGKFRMAETFGAELARLYRDSGRARWAVVGDFAVATILAERGETERALAMIADAERELRDLGGSQGARCYAQYARGRAAMVDHDYDTAFAELARVFDRSDVLFHPFARHRSTADLVEAALRSGRSDDARRLMDDLEEHAARQGSSSFFRATVTYLRPLIAGEQDAELLFDRALGGPLAGWPFLLARTQLNYGQWLRRQRRLIDARTQLRAAVAGLDSLGATSLADDARAELRAAGEAAPPSAVQQVDDLTPQELQIARLAASGLTNREIGMQLFLSHRTVGYHLYRIFPKLGITSRAQLRALDLGPE
ncbi:LuxR family transcriptional regulator [Nocardioides sp. CER19]|uniref:helix-turn-helix transcriptional regulator n=1 Tax=Nocardioides sp. CER19 TaxID=3038538 RepID=UPI0024471D24|nr:LuxR family transcriptional regulator [Nocardioides sp. CER19]MDH2415259.1 AAA family ATPase [Nocardioides sp. CER19]